MKKEENSKNEITKLSKKQLIEIINFLEEIHSEWYHPNEDSHRHTTYLFRELCSLFKKLNSPARKTLTNPKKLIEELYNVEEIDDLIETLHNVMFCYMEYLTKGGLSDMSEYFKQYKLIRDFLIKLSSLEKELNPFKHCTTELEVLPKRLLVSTFLKARKMDFEQFKGWWFEPKNYSLSK